MIKESRQYKTYTFDSIVAAYSISEKSGAVGLVIYPQSCAHEVKIAETPVDSLVQVALAGDTASKGFTNGWSMHNSETTQTLTYLDQSVEENQQQISITTQMQDAKGNLVTHLLTWHKGYPVLEMQSRFENRTATAVWLENLSSFSISQLSPFSVPNQPRTLSLTRFRSKWAMEGRLERHYIEDYQLEPSWKPSGGSVEKIGQVGSMPVRGFFPYLGVADEAHQVYWAFQLAIPTSWQIEAYRKQDDLIITGGLADYNYGHWRKSILPGDHFETPIARVTVGTGSQEAVNQQLATLTQASLVQHPNSDATELPIVFNEFCTSWGTPRQADLEQELAIIKQHQVKYFVIDAGWYADQEGSWENKMGDWTVSEDLFPDGLAALSKKVRQAGLIPGIWFEFEVVGKDSIAFNWVDHLVKKDGLPVTAGTRRFWDMTDPWVQDYLTQHVIQLLKDNDIGYLKIDYNENIGVGCDDESLGEGLRKQILATQAFIQKIRTMVPGIVIENCSSGGHRLEPSMMALTDMSSYSDAHETWSIPIIAATLQQHMLPVQAQIWAVLHQADSIQQIQYVMSATFLGRMCLSGDVIHLSQAQWQSVDDGIAFYQRLKTILKKGQSTFYGRAPQTYGEPDGSQLVIRETTNEQLLVFHNFKTDWQVFKIEIDWQKWQIDSQYGEMTQVKKTATGLSFTGQKAYCASAIYLVRR